MATIFISGQNPMYRKFKHNENMRRHADLGKILRGEFGENNVMPTHFMDKTNEYQELGYKVRNIPIRRAVRIARDFRQAAIIIDGQGWLDLLTMRVYPPTLQIRGRAALEADTVTRTMNMHGPNEFIHYDFDFNRKGRRIRA